jgi:protein SCO1/2
MKAPGGGIALAILAATPSVLGPITTPCRAAEPPAAPDEGRFVGRALPDITVQPAGAPPLRLAESWREKPLLLVLVFTRCAGLCSPFLSSLAAAQGSVGGAGVEYRTLVLSFDPRDSSADMAGLAARLDLTHAPGWTFGIAEPADIERLSSTFGFWFQWDGVRQQYDHPGLLVAVDAGRVVRLLLGTRVEAVRLQEIVRDLRGEPVGAYPLPGRTLFRCFQYRPETGRLALDWGFSLLLAPGAVAILGTVGLFSLARRARRRSSADRGPLSARSSLP